MATKKLSKLQENLTAYHEAGHAVAFYLFGIKLKFITIIPNFEKGELGRVQPDEEPYNPFLRFYNAPSVLEARIDFERLVIVKFAGLAAETKHRYRRSKSLIDLNLGSIGNGIRLRTKEDPTPDGDFDTIRLLFQNFPMINTVDSSLRDFEHESYFQWLWFRTATIITGYDESWNAVEALATALLEKKELTGKQAEKIMAKYIKSRLTTSSLHLTGEQMIQLL